MSVERKIKMTFARETQHACGDAGAAGPDDGAIHVFVCCSLLIVACPRSQLLPRIRMASASASMVSASVEPEPSAAGQSSSSVAAAAAPRRGWGPDGKRLSKAEKRAQRKQLHIEKKQEWRARGRAFKKLAVQQRKAEHEAQLQSMSAEERAAWESEDKTRRDALYDEKTAQARRVDEALAGGMRVALDLSYGDRMTEKEHASLARQLTRCWGLNRRAAAPCALHLTGMGSCPIECLPRNGGRLDHLSWKVGVHEEDVSEAFRVEDLVFLSPDASEVLTELDPAKVYVVGGLVDSSVKKQQSLSKAVALGARVVRLPLAESGALVAYGRIPLTLTAVLELLLEVHAGAEWGAAVQQAVAPRLQREKTQENGRAARRAKGRAARLATWDAGEGGPAVERGEEAGASAADGGEDECGHDESGTEEGEEGEDGGEDDGESLGEGSEQADGEPLGEAVY